MLVLTRKEGQGFDLIDGDRVTRVIVHKIKGGRIRLAIYADADIKVMRDDLKKTERVA